MTKSKYWPISVCSLRYRSRWQRAHSRKTNKKNNPGRRMDNLRKMLPPKPRVLR